jgi:hypothetical protein
MHDTTPKQNWARRAVLMSILSAAETAVQMGEEHADELDDRLHKYYVELGDILQAEAGEN